MWLLNAAVLATSLTLNFSETEFIESDGARALPIGYMMTPSSRIEVDFALTATAPLQQRVFGADGSAAKLITSLYVNSAGQFSFGVGDSFQSYPTGIAADLDRHVAIVDYAAKSLAFVTEGETNYTAAVTASVTNDSAFTLDVFGRSLSVNGSVYDCCSNVRVYGIRIYEDGSLVREYVPVSESGSPALRETLTRTSYPYVWKVPHWDMIVTQPGIFEVDKGHVQGICVTTNGIYFSQVGTIAMTDWRGRLVRKISQTHEGAHTGDLCAYKGRIYAAVCSYDDGPYFGEENGEPMKGCIQIYDEELNLLKQQAIVRPPDGITVLDGVLYLGLGCAAMYQDKPWRGNWYCKYNAETLEPMCEKFMLDHGYDTYCGIQNITTDGTYVYMNYYTVDENERTPNFVKYDKDLNVVAVTRFGHGQGVDFLPGGTDGKVRFIYCATANWMAADKTGLEVQGVLQFAEWDGRHWRNLTRYFPYTIPWER